ncbi:MAG: hypothetical protein IH985_06440 [Planctomycetes bacterium]|nr:hypothetical protein [Planctomycetota bacterium]
MPPGVSPIERHVHAVMGQPLVIPVRFGPDTSPAQPIRAVLDDGRPLETSVYWIAGRPSGRSGSYWLADPGHWTATPASDEAPPSSIGFWVIMLDPPVDAAGQGVWLNRRRLDVNWLAHPGLSPPVPAPIAPEIASSDRFRLLCEPERHSPTRRWRPRMLDGRLGAIPLPGPDAPKHAADDAFDDPVIEAWAMQEQARWAAGLASLRSTDAALADRLASALCRVADIDDVHAPAWPTDARELDQLRSDLLNPSYSAARRSRFVSAWLDAQPTILTWVADDAGTSDAVTGRTVSTLAATNVGEHTEMVAMVFNRPTSAMELKDVQPGETVLFRMMRSESAGPIEAATITVRADDRQWESLVLAEPIPVAPPGAAMSPMFIDRTLAGWRANLAGMAQPTNEPGGAAALLMRTRLADPQLTSTRESWSLYIECITGDAPPESGWVRVWIGPSGAPLIVLTIHADGRVDEERVRRTGARSVAADVAVARRDDRFSCLIPVPDECIDSTGVVRIGFVHMDESGRRSAWPRPMFPWHNEPARAAFDTTQWGSLSIFR